MRSGISKAAPDGLVHPFLFSVRPACGCTIVFAMSLPHRYSDSDRAAIYRVIAERRDMRHFRSDPVPAEILQRVLHAAHQAPSVGLMQPWRFIRITDAALREQIHALVDTERLLTAQALGERDAEFLRLKVEGVRDCAELWVAA